MRQADRRTGTDVDGNRLDNEITVNINYII